MYNEEFIDLFGLQMVLKLLSSVRCFWLFVFFLQVKPRLGAKAVLAIKRSARELKEHMNDQRAVQKFYQETFFYESTI